MVIKERLFNHCCGHFQVTAGRQELLYASVRSAPAAWNVCVHDDWKPLNLEMSAWIEDKHSNDMAKANMKEYIEVRQLW